MKKIAIITALVSLCFATGFTCSKNAPEQTAQPTETTAPATQEGMAAPTTTETGTAAPATTEPAPGTAAPGTAAPGGTTAPTETK